SSRSARRAGIAGKPAAADRGMKWQHYRIDLPERVVFPGPRGPDRKALLGGEPLVINVLRANPAEEVLGRLLVLRIAHDEVRERHVIAELTGWPLGQRRMESVVLERRALLGQIGLGLASSQEINRGAVASRTAGVRQECTVVARVVPREPAFVKRLFIGTGHEFDRLDRLPG